MLHGSAAATVGAPPDRVFRLITDVSRLPEWNAIMTEVVDAPAELIEGSEWVVAFKAMNAMRWRSRSRCEELDPVARRFRHRSGTDDGNPSYALWTWEVLSSGEKSTVKVSWELHPVTVMRRVALSRVRQRMLSGEVEASLQALARLAEAEWAGHPEERQRS